MKKRTVKDLCTLLAILMMLSSITVVTSAYSGRQFGFFQSEEILASEFSEQYFANGNGTYTSSLFATDISDADTPYLFYSQLSDTQKTMYSELVNAGISESFVSANTYSGSGTTVNDALAEVKSKITVDVVAALTAVSEDKPMYFWLNGFKYGFSYYQSTTETGYSVQAVNVTVGISIDTDSYTDFADVKEKYDLLSSAVKNVSVKGISRYEKVKSIHDYICKISEYPELQTKDDGTTWYGSMAHQPTGVFLNGLAVCEGYAEAFKILCDREEIPCITVLGTGGGGAHKWNYVKMEDGKWYLVDATWNDQTSYVFNDYLLNGSATKTPHFYSSTADSNVHVPDGQMYSGVNFTLEYPALSDDSYGMFMLNYNVGDITIDANDGVIYVGKDITTLQSKFTAPSDFSISLSSQTDFTGGTLTVKNNTSTVTKKYIFAMRGDANGSNSLTNEDYQKIMDATVAKENIKENTAEYYAADLNHDGTVDGYDALLWGLYKNGYVDFN